jgi:hypothetical protein
LTDAVLKEDGYICSSHCSFSPSARSESLPHQVCVASEFQRIALISVWNDCEGLRA